MRMRRTGRIVLLVALAAACERTGDSAARGDTTAATPAEPTPVAQHLVDSVTNAFVAALRAGNAAEASSYYATDAVFISARGKVEGQAAITAFWTDAVKDGSGKALEFHPLRFGASGDLAWQLAHFTGGITAPTGHVLAVYQRQTDGSIKVVAQVSIPEQAAR